MKTKKNTILIEIEIDMNKTIYEYDVVVEIKKKNFFLARFRYEHVI